MWECWVPSGTGGLAGGAPLQVIGVLHPVVKCGRPKYSGNYKVVVEFNQSIDWFTFGCQMGLLLNMQRPQKSNLPIPAVHGEC